MITSPHRPPIGMAHRAALGTLALLAGLYASSASAAKPLADLTVASLTAPASAAPGETLSLIYTVANRGPGQSNGSTLGCTLSVPSGAMSVGTVAVPRLKRGEQVTSALSVTIPPSVLPGSYTLTMTADVTQTVNELSEGNNARSVSIEIVTAGVGEAILTWNPNSEPDLAGYRTHYGTASRAYTSHTDVGLVTTFTEDQLTSGFTYFFAVTAYNEGGYESGYSNEASKFVP